MDQVGHRFKNFFPLAPGDKAAADVESVAADLVCLIAGILFDKTVTLKVKRILNAETLLKPRPRLIAVKLSGFAESRRKTSSCSPFIKEVRG